MKNKCKIGGAGRNDSGFLDFDCEYCHRELTEKEEGIKTCVALVAQESETANALYTEVKAYEKLIAEVRDLVSDDVPHEYQERLLNVLSTFISN